MTILLAEYTSYPTDYLHLPIFVKEVYKLNDLANRFLLMSSDYTEFYNPRSKNQTIRSFKIIPLVLCDLKSDLSMHLTLSEISLRKYRV
jgi:hypothetical protein